MEITLKGSSVIFPAQDTPKLSQYISNLDMVMTMYHFPLVYFYKPNVSSDFFEPQVLKEALSKALVPFYPLAGRLGSDENGRIQIICNGEGALFIEAETTSSIDDFGDFAPSSKLRQLIPTVDNSADVSTHPLVISQVTTFKCGGVCLGVGIHHTVADGTSVFHFINSWSEIERGLSLSVAPLIDRTLLRARVPPTPTFHHVEYDPSPSLNTSISTTKSHSHPKPLSVSTFKITKDQIYTLKAKLIKNENTTTKYSTHNVLAAHIWRCASKARGLLDDQATKLYIPTNGRPRLRPPLSTGYLGNVLFTTASIALSGDLLSEPLTNTADRVQKAVEKMDNEYLRSALDYLEKLPNLTSVRHGAHTFECPNLYIISWMRLPVHDADFGWGGPTYMGPANIVHEGKIYLLPSPTDDGSLSLVACLQTSHMKLFQKLLYQGLIPTDKIMSRI